MGWLAGAASKVAGAVSLRPWLLAAAAGVVVVLMAGAGFVGARFERAGWQARQIEAIAAALETERAGAGLANAAETEALGYERKQREKAHETIEELRRELAKKPARCPVSRAAVRLLDGPGVPAAPRPAPDPERAAPPVAADAPGDEGVECAVVVENCAWNRVNVCEPNAQQLEATQRFYDRVRQRYNAPR